jgi:hypothetical protein
MEKTTFVLMFAMLALKVVYAQDRPTPEAETTTQSGNIVATARSNDSSLPEDEARSSAIVTVARAQNQPESLDAGGKFRYYLGETYLNPSVLTAPALRASIRMANPPGHFPTAYPADWRQGAEGFARNYGDAMAQRISFQSARFATGVLIREDPRYVPSASHNILARSLYAFSYTFVDRSDSGHHMPAFSNFVGATAAGFVGNTYLPPGFGNVTHAGQRATLQFGFFAAGNLYREFAPQMPKPMRIFFELIGR